ncbi:prolipoprotein diacylglyceryl transferase [Hirschia litorea]|uniref:Phosphatidylglycerol--prolipoprotein diacylglyceryl transferase n=1 Tax=Hirschia litorea TaxID=1199156 RepID=A0ABW2IME7_9PROT
MFVAIPFPEIDPAVFTIPALALGDFSIGPFPLRWYALAYIVGLLLAWRYASYLISKDRLWSGANGKSPVSRDDLDDFVFWAMMGVLIGGRLGYILFYQLPFEPDRIFSDPLMIFKMWEGGMSFHGGLIGVAFAMAYTAQQRGLSLLSLSDIGAATAPIALFLGRIANFINGELYGRPTDAPWGIRFPVFDFNIHKWFYQDALGAPLGSKVPVHPSQLYEAALEGFLLFTIISVAVWKFKIYRKPGLATGIFLVGYASARTIVENFREPDAHIGFLPGGFLTMGMLLSLPMVIGGLYLIRRSFKPNGGKRTPNTESAN